MVVVGRQPLHRRLAAARDRDARFLGARDPAAGPAGARSGARRDPAAVRVGARSAAQRAAADRASSCRRSWRRFAPARPWVRSATRCATSGGSTGRRRFGPGCECRLGWSQGSRQRSAMIHHGGTEGTKGTKEKALGVSQSVLGAAIEVHRVLGPGLLESMLSKRRFAESFGSAQLRVRSPSPGPGYLQGSELDAQASYRPVSSRQSSLR